MALLLFKYWVKIHIVISWINSKPRIKNASKLNEIMLLTNIAVAAQQLDITLEYDAANMKITNCPEANDYFHYEYRKGWTL